jgi:hypothetical protein
LSRSSSVKPAVEVGDRRGLWASGRRAGKVDDRVVVEVIGDDVDPGIEPGATQRGVASLFV